MTGDELHAAIPDAPTQKAALDLVRQADADHGPRTCPTCRKLIAARPSHPADPTPDLPDRPARVAVAKPGDILILAHLGQLDDPTYRRVTSACAVLTELGLAAVVVHPGDVEAPSQGAK